MVSLWLGCGKWVVARGVDACDVGYRLLVWLCYDSPIHFLKEAEFSWLMMISSFTGRVSSTLILLLSSGLKRLI